MNSDTYKLSYTQNFILQAELLGERDGKMNIGLGMRLFGEFDYQRAEKAVQKIFDYNEALRVVCVEEENEYVQRVLDDYIFKLNVIEATDYESAVKETYDRIKEPMDFVNDVMMKVYLYRISDEEHLIVFNIHHLISDGKVFQIVAKRFLEYYANPEAGRDENTNSFFEFLEEEEAYLASDDGKAELQYWKDELEGNTRLEFFKDESNENFDSTTVGTCVFEKKMMNELAQREKTSIFNIMLLAYHVAISGIHNSDDTTVGFSCANRTNKKYWDTVGYLSRAVQNRLIIKDEDKLSDLLRFNTKKMDSNIAHQRTSHLNQDTQFYIAISNYSTGAKAPKFNGIDIETKDFQVPRKLNFVTMLVKETKDKVYGALVCDTEMYGRERINRFKDIMEKTVSTLFANQDACVRDIK